MIANKLNIVKRGVKAAPLTYNEMDVNLSELVNVITDVVDNHTAQELINDDFENTNNVQDQALTTGLATKINIASIVDALTSTDGTKVLSAKQGKVLYDMLLANNATIIKYSYNLTAGSTVISGVDTAGKTLAYVPGTVMLVMLNGIYIELTKDYLAANGTSITLVDAVTQDSEASVTVFGAFTVADHYTKSESDVLRAAMYQSGSGYIEGLIPEWVSATSIKLGTGSAYIPGLGRNQVVDTALTLTGISLTASAWYYLYLYNNAGVAAIELVTTAPAASYTGKARTKTGDATRRFMGAFKTDASSQLFQFQLDATGWLSWIAAVNAVPFRVLNGGVQTTPVAFSLSAAVPLTSSSALLNISPNGGSTLLYYATALTMIIRQQVQTAVSTGLPFPVDATQRIGYAVTAGSTVIDVCGYLNER